MDCVHVCNNAKRCSWFAYKANTSTSLVENGGYKRLSQVHPQAQVYDAATVRHVKHVTVKAEHISLVVLIG